VGSHPSCPKPGLKVPPPPGGFYSLRNLLALGIQVGKLQITLPQKSLSPFKVTGKLMMPQFLDIGLSLLIVPSFLFEEDAKV